MFLFLHVYITCTDFLVSVFYLRRLLLVERFGGKKKIKVFSDVKKGDKQFEEIHVALDV